MSIQNIPPDFLANILRYGYLIIFLLVFLQEVGVPSPVPNELVLIFSGYLGFSGLLKFPLIVLSAIAGDLLGSGILFSLFFLFGKTIMDNKPGWIPISRKKLDKLSLKLQKRGFAGVFIGRVSPFIRGYVAVLLGLMNYPVKRYLIVLLSTATLWACVYVGAGFLVGPYWSDFAGYIANIQCYMGIVPLVILLVIILIQVIRYIAARMQPKGSDL